MAWCNRCTDASTATTGTTGIFAATGISGSSLPPFTASGIGTATTIITTATTSVVCTRGGKGRCGCRHNSVTAKSNDAQQSIWDAYATALRKNLESMQGMHKTMMGMMQAAMPVERLDRHIAAMDARLQSLKDIKPALDGLYAALSDEQKKKADTLLTGMGCMM